jgi:hypothetical protein
MPESLSRVNLDYVLSVPSTIVITPKLDGIRLYVVLIGKHLCLCSKNQVEVAARLPQSVTHAFVWEAEAIWTRNAMEIHLFDVRVHQGRLCRTQTWEQRQALLPDLETANWCQLLPVVWIKKQFWSLPRCPWNAIHSLANPVEAAWLTDLESIPTRRVPRTIGQALERIHKRSRKKANTNTNADAKANAQPLIPTQDAPGLESPSISVSPIPNDTDMPPTSTNPDHPSWFWHMHDKWYKIDGLVMQSRFHTHGAGILKWKPPSHTTVDFQLEGQLVDVSQRQPSRSCGWQQTVFSLGPPSWAAIVRFYDKHSPTEYVHIPAKLQSAFQGKRLVAECWYDRRKGVYVARRLRPDKTYGNAILTHIRTLYDQLDNLQLADFCSSVP